MDQGPLASYPVTIYLAGAIRDGYAQDIEWRERFVEILSPLARVLSPLAGKTYNPRTKLWKMCGLDPAPSVIVPHDLWGVDRCDLFIANLLSLAEGYPSLGTLIEFGRATKTGALIYSIVAPDYRGHESPEQFPGVHPFIRQNSAMIFSDAPSCLLFVRDYLRALADGRFAGEEKAP